MECVGPDGACRAGWSVWEHGFTQTSLGGAEPRVRAPKTSAEPPRPEVGMKTWCRWLLDTPRAAFKGVVRSGLPGLGVIRQ